MRVAFFGRFENMQKGVVHFINAVNMLGAVFFSRHNVELSLYGKGSFGSEIDVSLFTNIAFLQGDDLIQAYAKTDVVVMPSRYEPFGLVGLEAMAAGCLLLATAGQGMDEYAIGGKTCVTIPSDERGIASILELVICNFKDYKPIAAAGREAVQIWTWERSVFAHMKVYQQIIHGNHLKLSAAYRSELTNVNSVFKSDDIEIRVKELAKIRFLQMKISVSLTNFRMLYITVGSLDDIKKTQKSLTISVTEKDDIGMNPRLECLFYDDEQFECVCVIGAWESVFNPKFALNELFRIVSKRVIIVYRVGTRFSWQTIMMEGVQDWSDLQGKDDLIWELVSDNQHRLFSDSEYKYVEWLKKGV
ncbi:MAG TPA: glycosyltransferase family 4 protein [Treponemataceae bacterium]|nr:glycosyltransferase family 4 protein [Treponemataceae bacterium]